MIRSFTINSYLCKEFLKIMLIVSIVFFGLGLIINLFEEINFFKDFDVAIDVPIYMSLLFVPSFHFLNYQGLQYNLFFLIIVLNF